MLIAATSDIHAPRYLQSFLSSPETKPDIFLLAGDICEVLELEQYKNVYKKLPNCPILACFGNTESRNRESRKDYDNIRKLVPEIKFLEEEAAKLKINGKTICVIGSKGVIDYPVKWQRDKIPNILEIHNQRREKLKQLIENANSDINILIMHHPPTFSTMGNENPAIYSALGSKNMEETIKNSNIDIIIHGHLHLGAKKGFIGNKPVFNVAFPVSRHAVEINTDSVIQ